MIGKELKFNEEDEIVCKYWSNATVVCLDRCTKHQCITCRKPQHPSLPPYGTEEVMNPRSRWQHGMGIGNRSGEEAERFQNDWYMSTYWK